jgi:hypothetical protein
VAEEPIVSGMAGRYATALFEVALEQRAVDATEPRHVCPPRGRIVVHVLAREEAGPHRPDLVDPRRDARALQLVVQATAKLLRTLLDPFREPRLGDEIEHGDAGGHRQRVPGERPRLVDRTIRRHLPHDVGAASVRAHRQPSADHLAQARQIGIDPEPLLRAAARDAKAGHHLVADEEPSRAPRLLAQRLEETWTRQQHAHVAHHRLDDGRRRLFSLRSPEVVAHRRCVVVRQHGGERRQRPRDTGRVREPERLHAGACPHQQRIGGAVEAAFELDDALASGEPAGHPQRRLRRLRP